MIGKPTVEQVSESTSVRRNYAEHRLNACIQLTFHFYE